MPAVLMTAGVVVACAGAGPTTTLRVVAGEIEVGVGDEGDWLAVRVDRAGRSAPVSVGRVDGDALHQPGAVLGEVDVPVDTTSVALSVLACSAQGCDESEMEEHVEGLGPDDWLCSVGTALDEGSATAVVLDWPTTGPASCATAPAP